MQRGEDDKAFSCGIFLEEPIPFLLIPWPASGIYLVMVVGFVFMPKPFM